MKKRNVLTSKLISIVASAMLVVGFVPPPALAEMSAAAASGLAPAAGPGQESNRGEEPAPEAGPAPEPAPRAQAEPGGEAELGQAPDSEAAATEYPAFGQSATVDGVEVTVEADSGAFPAGARLSVESAPSSATEDAVAPEREEDANVAKSCTFDVKVLGTDGEELQPVVGDVRVSFRTAEVADPNLDAHVYHVAEGASEADVLEVTESGDIAEAVTDAFSYYTVEFTYDEKQYVLPGGSEVALSKVLDAVGLVGEPTAATSSAPELFSVEEVEGVWKVAARRAFSSTETLTVTLNGTEFEIVVTDDDSGTTHTVTYKVVNGT